MRSSSSYPVACLAVIVVGALLRPITSTSLWMEMSCGSVVLDGNLWPSQMLLVNERAADAEWLAGVPFVVAYSLWDAHGLMVLKLLGGILAAVICWNLAGNSSKAQRSSLIGLGFLASLASWDVSTEFWDVLGLVTLCWCLRDNESRLWPSLLALGIWAQLGCLSAVGLVIWSLARLWNGCSAEGRPVDHRPRRWLLEIFLAVIVCSLNPRGALSIWDSVRMSVPRIASDGATLLETEWRPLLAGPWDVSQFAFAGLTCIGLCYATHRSSSAVFRISVIIAIGLGWMCRAHVGFAGIWLSILLCRPAQQNFWVSGLTLPRWPTPLRNLDSAKSSESLVAEVVRLRMSRANDRILTNSATELLNGVARWAEYLSRRSAGFVLMLLMLVAWWPWEGRRPGWGLDSRLDERLLERALSQTAWQGTAWADDESSAGMCLWVTNQRMKIHDTPRRALLGGRLREFVSLRRDLEQGHLAAYQRVDHSAGGWWLPLRDRGTVLLVVSAQQSQLLRALERTIWKPLALDSAVLPFGQSGAPEVSPQIIDVLRQRDLIENEAWSPTLRGPTGTDRLWDLWGSLRVSPNVEQELQQARVFRALQLPRAGLRVLEPALQVSQSRALQLEAALSQRDLSFDPVEQSRSSAVALTVVPPVIDRCVECHAEQARDFPTTGHHHALRPFDHELTRELLGSATPSHPVDILGLQLWCDSVSGQLFSSSPLTEVGVPAQWLFGSGKHARTPVSVWLNADGSAEALEHRLSWYPDHGWGTTLGLNPTPASHATPTGVPGKDRRAALESLGKIHDPAATRDCFGCHTTRSPLTGDVHGGLGKPIVPGVSCERCHPGSDRHAETSERGSRDVRPDSWRSLTPLDSVNRCGECHRRADHLTPDELHPDNQMLIRFASVGLVQSACFREQNTLSADRLSGSVLPRFDCMTCHDPHRPAQSEPAFYSARCATCHDTAATKCSQQPRDSNCLPCHMPKVEVQSPLQFTDHWIRIRKSSRPARQHGGRNSP